MCDVAERLEKKGRTKGRNEILDLLKWLRTQGRSDDVEKVLEGDSELVTKLLEEMSVNK